MSATPHVVASSVVIGNVMYVVGAIVLMVVISLILVMRQRKPKSVEANMESFNRGLRALAPSTQSPRLQPPRGAPAAGPARSDGGGRVEARRKPVQSVVADPEEPTTEAGSG